ncbi:MAG: lipid-transfer protein [Actinobacteria bacterium]|nr:lipid-transfer protein [Actinomycetota bacterium]
MPIKDRTAIVGVGQTAFAKHLEQPEKVLALEAILIALEDAGIDPSEVDGLSSYTMEGTEEIEIARNLGMDAVTWFSQVGYGGGAGCGVVGNAAMAVAAGQCNVAVAWRSRKRGAAASRPWAGVRDQVHGNQQWSRPFGLLRPVDEIAVLTRRYMHEFGATREHLCNVATAVRSHANRNPGAMMHAKELTRDQYMGARWISEPLCLFDNCLESDGAGAVVIVRRDRADDCRQQPVYIHSFAQSIPAQHQTMTNYFNDDPLVGPSYACAELLWRHADFGAHDIDVAQLYDAFSPLVILSLEGYGFCDRGEGAGFTDGNTLGLEGRLPVNTSGGGLSEAYVHGFNLIVEGVNQMRGQSCSQVEGAETCLVTSGEGVPTSALLLRN